MVKLYHVGILLKHPTKAVFLASASDLSQFSYFQRNSVKEFMDFTSKVLVERSQPATRTSVKERDYMCHVLVCANKLSASIISDHEYPHRVAHTMLTKLLEEFEQAIPPHLWTGDASSIAFPSIEKYLVDYQDPRKADALTKMQEELDETKIILHNTLEAVLERGDKLDDLIAKSDDLSMTSKQFYKTARKTNACCVIL